MSKKIAWISVILLITIIVLIKAFSNNGEEKDFKPIDKNIGDEFTELSYPNKMFIINYKVDDVNGDSENDMVLLIGEARDGNGVSNENINNMDVVIYDSVGGKFLKAGADKLIGKNNKIEIGDFTGDQVKDIMIITENDGVMKIRIFAFEFGKLKEIWKERNNKGLLFNGEFIDGFKVRVKNEKLNLDVKLDVANRKDEYMSNNVYDKSGKLIGEKKNVITSGFKTVDVVKLNDRNGTRTTQVVYGINNNDIIDEIQIVWKYNDGRWQMVEARGMKLGNLLY